MLKEQLPFALPTVDWMMIAPILIVALTGVVALLVETIWPKKANWPQWGISLLGLVGAGALVCMQLGMDEGSTLAGMMVRDSFGLMIQLLILAAALLSILFSESYLREKRIPFGEFYPLVLWSTVGAMVMATTHNLLVIFVGLEILSIALYVLAGMSRSEERSEESAMKYFLLGAFASAFLLYGISFIYGATGSLDIPAMNTAWRTLEPSTQGLVLFGGALVLVGLGFKSSLVPFHQWTPDVYQGAPTNVTAFMASASKIAALATLWRVIDDSRALAGFYLPILFWLAILTMTVGNLIALVQKDVKRILGYSSISHAGYVLVAIAANLKDPIHTSPGTIVYYLLAYTLMTVGSFAIVSMVAKGGRETTRLEDLNGLLRRSPIAGVSLIVFMISLIGMPPTAGFLGKWMIFNDALTAGLPSLAIVLAMNSAISIYYYLGIVRAAGVVEEEGAPTASMNFGLRGTTVLCLAGVILATLFVTPVLSAIQR